MTHYSEILEASAIIGDAHLDSITGGWSLLPEGWELFPKPDMVQYGWKNGNYVLEKIYKYKNGEYNSDKDALEKALKINGGIHRGAFGM